VGRTIYIFIMTYVLKDWSSFNDSFIKVFLLSFIHSIP
jgi:hypothetical protein